MDATAPVGLLDFLVKVHQPGGPPFMVTVLFVCGAIIFVTAILAHQWRKVRQATLEASLKAQMIERGMSPADIEHVIRLSAGSLEKEEKERRKAEAIARDPNGATMETLIAAGYKGKDIEKIVSALALSEDRERKIADAKLVKKMAGQGMDGEDIAKLLRVRHDNNARVAV